MPKVIALDFDGCLVEDKWPDIGPPIQKTIDAIKKEIDGGAQVILWTCRVGDLLENAVLWCEEHEIKLDGVNEMPESLLLFGTNPRKIFADEYWDDRAIRMPKECDLSDLILFLETSIGQSLLSDHGKYVIKLAVGRGISLDEAYLLPAATAHKRYLESSLAQNT